MDGIFVTGTDTGVGKTTISAGLLKLLHGNKPVAYWKPIQTGTLIGDDTEDVRALTELGDENFLSPIYRYPDPVAPFIAARKWKQPVDLDKLVSTFKNERKGRYLIVEGAGGLLVPLTKESLQHELIKRLGLGVVLVAPNKLGTINQTLLTIEACRAEGIEVKGVILTKSREAPGQGNAECIQHYGEVDILGEFEDATDRKSVVSYVAADPGLRRLFKLSPLPI